MKFFYVIMLNFLVIMHNVSYIHAAEKEDDQKAVSSSSNTVQKPFTYYRLPIHLRQCIADFVGFNTPNKQGWLPLQAAVANGKLQRTLFLMLHGANANAQNPSHPTNPLCFTASYNHSVCSDKQKENYNKIGKHLLYHGANPCTPDEFGHTAIHQAVMHRNVSALQALIKIRTNINALNSYSQTPYDLAKTLAMNPKNHPDNRKAMYAICGMFEKIGAQSSVPLEPMRTDRIMTHQFNCSKK